MCVPSEQLRAAQLSSPEGSGRDLLRRPEDLGAAFNMLRHQQNHTTAGRPTGASPSSIRDAIGASCSTLVHMGGSKAYSYLTPHLALSPDVLFARVWYAKWLKAAWLLLAERGLSAFELGDR